MNESSDNGFRKYFQYDTSNHDATSKNTYPRSSQSSVNYSKPVPDNPQPKRVPHSDGASIGIKDELIAEAEAALEQKLPACPVNKELLEPLADQWNNEQITNHVKETLLASSIIASMLFIAKKLRTDCETYDTAFERIEQRHLNRQAKMPLKIPASKALSKKSTDANGIQHGTKTQSSWFVELLTFWRNWAGVGAAALAMALLMTLGLEILSQVNGLKRGSWELVQTYTGAFGFTWGFTVAVVAFTRWREQIREDINASHLNKVMSQRFIYIAWIGLANMGLHLGLMHSFGSDEPFLYGIHRCLLTTFSVISLGGVGVVIEKWTLNAAKKAYE